MFQTVDKSQTFYVLDLVNKTYSKIDNKNALTEWLKDHPDILSELNLSGKDIKQYYNTQYNGDYLDYKKITQIRRYMFFDGLYRVIDIRPFIPDTFNAFGGYWSRLKRWYKGMRFRITPVPYTGKLRKYGYYRFVHTQQERRLNAAPEYKEYVRPSRRAKNIPAYWDEIPRHRTRCWKNQSKKEKQWM